MAQALLLLGSFARCRRPVRRLLGVVRERARSHPASFYVKSTTRRPTPTFRSIRALGIRRPLHRAAASTGEWGGGGSEA